MNSALSGLDRFVCEEGMGCICPNRESAESVAALIQKASGISVTVRNWPNNARLPHELWVPQQVRHERYNLAGRVAAARLVHRDLSQIF